jgi:hypothetical protein
MAGQCNSLKRSGERGRNRTFNLLIKSQLLCQLSYAPTVWNLNGWTIFDCNISVGARSLLRRAKFKRRISKKTEAEGTRHPQGWSREKYWGTTLPQ